MEKRPSKRSLLARKGSYYLAAKILLSLLLLANAASIQVSVFTPRQSLTGGALTVSSSSNLSGADRGFSKAGSTTAAAGISCGSPITFSATAGTANNAISTGDIVYDVQLNTTGSTPANTCFTVTLTITPNSGSQTVISVYMATGATVTAGQTIDCKFDIGTSYPSSPYSFKVAVS